MNREMLEMRRRLNDIPGLPKVKTGRADEFFKGLHERVETTDRYVHTWDGELYLEYHRGTYTSQAYNKRMNRTLELLYRETEWLSVLTSVTNKQWDKYPQDDLRKGWKIILRNQFHDIIPGSSIHEVYEDSRLEYEVAEKLARSAWKEVAHTVAEKDTKQIFTVFNSASWKRSDLIEIPSTGLEQGVWKDAEGNVIAAVQTGEKWLVRVKNIPALGYTSIQFHANEVEQDRNGSFDIHQAGITTPFYKIAWNDNGQLVSIYDRQAGREVLAKGRNGNILQVFEDKPMRFDAWDIDLFYQEKMREITELQMVEIVETTPLRTVVRFKWLYMDSIIQQDMMVYADNRRIDFNTEVDWHEQNQLLKVAFPVAVRSTEATYDIQYGNVKRPTHWNTSWDFARFETVGHQWADLSERGYGVSLLNNCKYGYDIKDNVVRLSLIKSATYPDHQQDQGKHVFTYALLPHEGDWAAGNTVQEAWKLNSPLTYTKGQPAQSELSLFHCTTDHILFDAVKKAENSDKIVLRLHEFTGSRKKVTVESGLPIQSWQECSLMEEEIGETATEGKLTFEINPYEIKTFLIDVALD